MHYWQINIDTGGTFTDCLAIAPNQESQILKVLSNSSLKGKIIHQLNEHQLQISLSHSTTKADLWNGYTFFLNDQPNHTYIITHFDTTQQIITLQEALKDNIKLPTAFTLTAYEEAPILAARIATQSPLNEALPPIKMRLASTKATNALLEHKGAKVALLITKGFADLLEIGTQQRPDLFALNIQKPKPLYDLVVEIEERLDANGEVLQTIDEKAIINLSERLHSKGITSIAIALMHSYKNPQQEYQLKAILEKLGWKDISISYELAPLIKLLPRTQTTVVNAYLHQIMQSYLDGVAQKLANGHLHIMTSAGGLIAPNHFKAKDGLLSGPAGGVVGAAFVGQQAGFSKIISFDMGGTSTDVARYDAAYEYTFEQNIGNTQLMAPALAIQTVAAGGGSICQFDGFTFSVGPESAGADPGPACYGAGGPLTITDVNLLLGRLAPDHFQIPLAIQAAQNRLNEIMQEVKKAGQNLSPEAVLEGFLQIANEKMADAIRKISTQKGFDPKDYALVAFGGAGGQHACAIATLLGMSTILISPKAGILSALGLYHARIERFAEKQILQTLDAVIDTFPKIINTLQEQAQTALITDGISAANINYSQTLIYLRLQGQSFSLEVEWQENLIEQFQKKYQQLYGHWPQNAIIEVETIRVIMAYQQNSSALAPPASNIAQKTSNKKIQQAYLQGQWQEIEFCPPEIIHANNAHLAANQNQLVTYSHSTLLIQKDWQAHCKNDILILERLQTINTKPNSLNDHHHQAIQLSLFTNRFQAIATEMGAMLQRTALSVNVKERLDFSCAILDVNGELVVNAPHIPVHLGSLGVCVRSVLATMDIGVGDVIITNHPAYGGSHLPDITLISPVYTEDGQTLLAYVANRAHHAEIGGMRPGSMPPNATNLAEEGVVIPPTYLVKNGEMQWSLISNMLTQATYPTRALKDNLADLNAALAANRKGVLALQKMAIDYGAATVQHYMQALNDYVANKLLQAFSTIEIHSKQALEYLDDGHRIQVSLNFSPNQLYIDFTGTGNVHPNNLNANPAIVNSAVIYVLRLWLGNNLPLNEGLLQHIQINIPQPSFLNPSFNPDPQLCPAVVGGNTEISQRVVDTLLKAFELVAGSQGTMNNVLFGNEHFGYYETIGGGSGAGDGFNGADAVHTHMTNTRITDPEILELRYPVRLDQFAIRPNSGGLGKFKGGNGIIRKITFLEAVALSILSQHRQQGAYGLAGGESGQTGQQFILTAAGKHIPLAAIAAYDIQVGDSLLIYTPGGGGFGKVE